MVKRREFILIPARALGGLVVSSLVPLVAQEMVKVPLRFFTAAEARVVNAAAERIFPGDESGPGATDAGVVIYIDRQLAGPYGKDKYRYTKGPWIEAGPEHGYQGKETPREIYRAGLKLLPEGFVDLPVGQQDEALEKIQERWFFQLLHAHTVEGMFCDPLHGGNIGMVGWKLIGFPGPRMSYRYEIEKYRGQAYREAPKSLEQILRHPVKAAEDELVDSN